MTRDPRNLMWAEACALLDKAEQLHRQFFEPAREGTRPARWEPPIDVLETERQLRIIVALPGVAPEAVQVQTEGGILTIIGSRPLPGARRERQYRAAWEFPMAASSAALPCNSTACASPNASSRTVAWCSPLSSLVEQA